MRIIDLHAIPLAHCRLTFTNDSKRAMDNFIKNQINQDGRILSNVNGYQSNDLDYLNNSFLNLLKNTIEEKANIFSQQILEINKELSMGNMWLNVNGYKDYNHSHVHPGAIVSGAFYCNVPKENSGAIRFNVNKDVVVFVEEKNISKYNKYNSGCYDIYPKTLDLLLFPAWLWHEVRPNMNKKEKRITISFNCQ